MLEYPFMYGSNAILIHKYLIYHDSHSGLAAEPLHVSRPCEAIVEYVFSGTLRG